MPWSFVVGTCSLSASVIEIELRTGNDLTLGCSGSMMAYPSRTLHNRAADLDLDLGKAFTTHQIQEH